jgi:DNA-binding transcriptional ArsR family regulator
MISRAITSFQRNRRDAEIAVGFVAMLCLLAYTFWHTGGLLARYITPGVLGYVAAFGIELSVVAMAFRIGELGWTAPNATPFKWTLAGVLGVSVLANLAEGYAARYDGVLVVDAVGRLDPIQGIIGVAATALLSIVVYALAEIVGADVRPVQEASIVVQMDKTPVQPPSTEPNADPLLSYLASNPDASYSDIGAALNVSKSTASNRVKALMDAGAVSRNGHGWELHA